MKNNDPFLDFLESTAGTYEAVPPADVRHRHLAALAEETAAIRRKRLWRTGLLLSAILMVVSTTLFWWLKQTPSMEDSNGNQIVSYQPDEKAAKGTREVLTSPATTALETSREATPLQKENQTFDQQLPAIAFEVKEHPLTLLPVRKLLPVVAKPHASLSGFRKIPAKVILLPMPDSTAPTKPSQRKVMPWIENFSAGVHYTPEWMFNTLDQTDRLVHNFGAELSWSKKPFSIRSGISVSLATGVTDLAYTYNENLGVKQKLDSVSFAWDEEGRKIVPTWYFSEKSVFDTATDFTVTSVRKRYLYLQIPLILGFDFYQTQRLSIGLRSGPVMQILLNTSQLDANPSLGNNRVISINQLTPERLSLHWQALFGFNTTFVLSKRFNLEIEPHVKYYFNSVYEKAATRQKPWSLEVRSALIIKL
jgi:hypothetical protein